MDFPPPSFLLFLILAFLNFKINNIHMVERLAKPPELIIEKEAVLHRAREFSKYADLGEISVYEEKGLLKYMLYNQNTLSFGEGGREKFLGSLETFKVGRERKGMELVIKVIDKFGYVPEDMAYDVLAPYTRTHKQKVDNQVKYASYKRAKTLIDASLSDGCLKKELWKPRGEEHLEYWVWYELKNRRIFDNWPFVSNENNKHVGRPISEAIYSPTVNTAYIKPKFKIQRHEFVESNRNTIDKIMRKFDSRLAGFSYEKEGRNIFLRCGLTVDWIIAFEIPLPKALELAKTHPENWMEKRILTRYSEIKLPRGGSVETWKANIEYSKLNGIKFKENTAILMTDHQKFKESHRFFVEKGIQFNDFLQIFTFDLERIKKNYEFCVEQHLQFNECLKLLVIPTGQLRENYDLCESFRDRIDNSGYPHLLVKPTEKLKKRFGVDQPQAI